MDDGRSVVCRWMMRWVWSERGVVNVRQCYII